MTPNPQNPTSKPTPRMSLFKKEEPQPVTVYGNDLKCPVCGNNKFYKDRALMNKSMSTFFRMDWTDRSAFCFVCSNCTYIFWFLGE
jgi:hypothetical protein